MQTAETSFCRCLGALRRCWPALVAGLALYGGGLVSKLAAANDSDPLTDPVASITEKELRRHIEILADDTFEGRETGSRGGRAASLYIIKELERLQLAPAGDGRTWFQNFNAASRNILARLEGSDPALRDEVIVVSAHYDHVGYGTPKTSYGPIGYIHNGADDNASGVSGLLEVIEAIVEHEVRPARTILFAFWDAEEQGLLGSKHWVEQPTLSLSQVRAMINVDMIGRLTNDQVQVYGVRTLPGWRKTVASENRTTDLVLDFTWEMKEYSDHWSFYNKNLPCLMLHTGLHKDYHRPSDDIETLNYPGIRRVTELLLRTTCNVAQREAPIPTFRLASRSENVDQQAAAERPLGPLPSRLGVRWDPLPRAGGGVLLTQVTARSPAEQAGLKTGDRIVEVNGQPVSDGRQLRRLVLQAEDAMKFKVSRGDQETEFAVRPSGSPVRLGITWRMDDAEPQVAILSRVVPGSPADDAGLTVNDRIYTVNDEGFSTSEEFRNLVTVPRPRMLLVERDGRLRRILVEPSLPDPAAETARRRSIKR